MDVARREVNAVNLSPFLLFEGNWQGNTVGLYLNGGAYADLKEVFDKLAAGADPDLLDELRDLPFGSYGHLADRYGVHWFFRGDRSTSSS